MKPCLNMIVKNESARIERALATLVPFISAAVIVDTGSTDDTKEKVAKFLDQHGIPRRIFDRPFVDWSQARNAALVEAKAYCLEKKIDYILLTDADMELVVKDAAAFEKFAVGTGLSFDMWQRAGATHYLNRRLVHAVAPGGYRGVTHEYLDIDAAGCVPEDVAYFVDHADGANRPEKYKRDIALLRQDLQRDPTNGRSMFYLGNSYRDAGKPDKAIKWYKRRIEAGGWDEEVWQAHVYMAHCYKDAGDTTAFVNHILQAYNRRPQRIEPLYDLSRFYREAGQHASSLLFAEQGMGAPKPNDALFVNDHVYNVGMKEEVSISAFYVPNKFELGRKVTSDLSLKLGPYDGSRHLARCNMYWYLKPLVEFCPSFRWTIMPFEPPEGYVAMNPSITLHDDKFVTNIRCVNYKIDDEGRYLIRGPNGDVNGDNPINTRNFIACMGTDPLTHRTYSALEVLPPPNLPVEYSLVTGFEDSRLISAKGELFTTSTVRQLSADGQCEQVLCKLDKFTDKAWATVDCKRMLRTPRETEKNWSYFGWSGWGPLQFMWKPGRVISEDGNFVANTTPSKLDTDALRGSSQCIWWGRPSGTKLAVVHEAAFVPGSSTRHYWHRFVTYSHEGVVTRVSHPFVFNERGIEFCAGAAVRDGKLYMSYGFKDRQARVCAVDVDEVEKFICQNTVS